ncbi:MAG: bifunctional trypsin-like peptidase domain-containing/SEL1-like repeat protein [Desulfobacteraceae bacterium]|nr:bifunctional trypsin-like peptidase domain-containing/SEL1-like repeat protein [Desulfobacteraceae bacterium]
MRASAFFQACAVSLALPFLLVAAAGAGTDELIRKVQASTVTVHVYDETGRNVAQGSGFMFKSPGHLISNYHVLGRAVKATVKTPDGKQFAVRSIVAEDSADDLVEAVVDITSGGLPCLMPARILPKAGDPVMVVGSPMGVEKTVSRGNIRSVEEVPKYGRCIVHTAHSFPGSSGSPVVNGDGDVIGIATASMTGKPDINVAVPLERFSGLSPKYRQLKTSPPQASQETRAAGAPMPQEVRQAESGDPAVLVKLAVKREFGEGASRDCFEALNLYRKAAGQGYAKAEFHVGRMYYEGKCMGKSFSEAARWLQKAASRGDPDAQLMYGKMCYNGDGMARDRVSAGMWTILAASKQQPDAVKLLRLMSVELTPAEFKEAEARAGKWKPVK